MKLLHLLLLPVLLLPLASAQTDALPSVLQQLKVELESHQWLKVLDHAEASHRRGQTVDLGIQHAQYVAELFGLNYTFNTIKANAGSAAASPRGLRRLIQTATRQAPASSGEPVTEADLNQIRSVRWREETPSDVPGWRRVTGTATLRNGRVLNLEANFVKKGGLWKLTGAVG